MEYTSATNALFIERRRERKGRKIEGDGNGERKRERAEKKEDPLLLDQTVTERGH